MASKQTVWILLHETQGGNDPGTCVIGVYASEGAAVAAQRDAENTAYDDGRSVWGYGGPDDADPNGDPDWDDSFTVEAWDVAAPAYPAPLTYGNLPTPAPHAPQPQMRCTDGCEGVYSADRGDYWQVDPAAPVVCVQCGAPMELGHVERRWVPEEGI